jgi:hypothetical protein
MTTEIFDSCVRSGGDLAGVFEYDGEVGYFYLYDVTGKPDKKVLNAIHIVTGALNLDEADFCIRWNADEHMVALYICGSIWAIFDTLREQKYGGNYRDGAASTVPPGVTQQFNA